MQQLQNYKTTQYMRELYCVLLPNGTDFRIQWILPLNDDPEFTTAFLLHFLLQNFIVTENVQEDILSNLKNILIAKLIHY